MTRTRKPYTGPLWVQVFHWEMDCPAYKLLSVYGRSLLYEFRRLYNAGNNSQIVMSCRQAADLLNCNKDTAFKALKELQAKGWICLGVKGCFSQKTDKTGSTWRITNQLVGMGVETPETKEYARWKPDGEN